VFLSTCRQISSSASEPQLQRLTPQNTPALPVSHTSAWIPNTCQLGTCHTCGASLSPDQNAAPAALAQQATTPTPLDTAIEPLPTVSTFLSPNSHRAAYQGNLLALKQEQLSSVATETLPPLLYNYQRAMQRRPSLSLLKAKACMEPRLPYAATVSG
jgi:hypothetical protein